VITPVGHRRLGRGRLEELRANGQESPIETAIVDRVRRSTERFHIVAFRGENDEHTSSWGFDDELPADEAYELAGRLVRSHLPTHRCLLVHGTYVMVHTDFGSREADLMRRASEEIHAELAARDLADEREAVLREADLWLLRHLSFYFSLPAEKVLRSVLPDKLPLIETRSAHLQAIADRLRRLG
jgi:hypothetical protein